MIRESYLALGHRRMRYLEAGAGWPLVLIHAFPLNADMWRPQLQRVPEGWRVIAPDLRGFGPAQTLSDDAGTVTLDDFAGDVSRLLDHLEIEAATIGGLSMGGYVTFALFRLEPDRFSGMILADTKAQADTAEGRVARQQMIELARATGARGVADQMLPKLLGETTRRARPELQAEVRASIESAPVGAITAAIGAMMARPDSTPDLAKMSCPALVIVGAEDVITPVRDAESMQQAIVRSTLVTIPDAGHLASLESPDVFSQAIADFLASHH
ncbi:MAG: alpha/beta fold hydrolase [Acidobacteriota bacterium]